MATTATTQCPKCGGDVLKLTLEPTAPLLGNPAAFTVFVNAVPDAQGHVVETGDGTGRTLLLDRSDAGGADIYKAHHLTCGT